MEDAVGGLDSAEIAIDQLVGDFLGRELGSWGRGPLGGSSRLDVSCKGFAFSYCADGLGGLVPYVRLYSRDEVFELQSVLWGQLWKGSGHDEP